MKYRCHSRSPSPSSRTYNTYNTYGTYTSNIRGVYGMNPIEAISFILGACTVNAQRCVYAENEHYSPTTPFRSRSRSHSRSNSKRRSSKRSSSSRGSSSKSSKSKKHQHWRDDFEDDDDATEITAGSSTSSQARRAAANAFAAASKNRRRSSSRSRSASHSRSRSRQRDVSPVARSSSRSHSKSRSRSQSRNTNSRGASPSRAPRSSSKSRQSSSRSKRSGGESKSKSSKGKNHTPLQLHREIIEVPFDHDEDPDDDVSAISAGTLEYLAAKQERIAVLNYANKQLKKNQSAPNLQQGQGLAQIKQVPSNELVEIDPTPLSRMRYSFDKENVVNMSSDTTDHASVSAASSGTSEFDSVWDNPKQTTTMSMNTPQTSGVKAYISLDEYKSGRKNADNNHSSAGQSSSRKLKVSSSSGKSARGMAGHYSKWETSSSRKLRRQIQRDGIGSIPEMDMEGMDEHEGEVDDFGMEPFVDADAVNNNSLLPNEEEI